MSARNRLLLALAAPALGLAGLLTLSAHAEDKVAPASSFAPIYQVLQHPRCQNCHPSGDAPHVGDQGMVHRMNVSRRSPEAGLPCSTCHRSTNAPFLHGPPGAPGWDMPPDQHPSPFEGRSAHDLCEQLKDPKRNGGKALGDLHTHVANDALVRWAWAPGPGREPPPMTHAELVKKVDQWIAEGAPCP